MLTLSLQNTSYQTTLQHNCRFVIGFAPKRLGTEEPYRYQPMEASIGGIFLRILAAFTTEYQP